jgi:hypothetical protein
MRNIDMSAKAVTARLKQISQLRRLALSLQKAKLRPAADKNSKEKRSAEVPPGPGPKAE